MVVTLVYEQDGRRRTEEFATLNECCHSAALRTLERSGVPKSIVTDDGRRWIDDDLRRLLAETTRRHGWA